ncbi:hypothetical protein PINS_up004321 [Pythium insidiosum]|nr:hypothetical protein PINS_up004321 [Pythium insidiosum]
MLHPQTLLLGALLAVGFFTRFTFPLFFFPLGLELVRRQDTLLTELTKKKDSQPSPVRRLSRALSIAFQGFIAFAVSSAVIVVLDSIYFHGTTLRLDTVLSPSWLKHHLVIAPLNNLKYNMQYDNLELHGVHPRVTHALVNMPMLFGPLVASFVSTALKSNSADQLWRTLCVAFPLVMISLAPHQEPRFLLPLLVPLHLFSSVSWQTVSSRASTFRLSLWLVFNVLLAVFFGVLHQGGIIPLMLGLGNLSLSGSSSNLLTHCQFTDMRGFQSSPLVFYKTYMPPRFLLSSLANHRYQEGFQVLDLAGGHAMQDQVRTLSSSPVIFVVAPSSVSVDSVFTAWRNDDSAPASHIEVASCGPHISTEDLDATFANRLRLFRFEKSHP